ncbi:MAG: hypothetical protein J0647_01560 [Campylobacteraceae bacterium]|nr:hypothetical protein [Campylobacteraceae bacterium]
MEKINFKFTDSEESASSLITMFTMFFGIVLGVGIWGVVCHKIILFLNELFGLKGNGILINVIDAIPSLIIAYYMLKATFYIALHLGVTLGFGGWSDNSGKTKARITAFLATHKWRGYFIPIDGALEKWNKDFNK